MPNSWKRHPLLFGGLLLALIAVALYGFRRAQGVPVEVAYTTRGPLVQTVVTTGRVRPQLLRVSALTTGRIAGLHGREGQVVEAGELLFELDRREAEARVQEAAAALERAQADRRSVGSVQLKQAQEVLTQAEARAAEAHADLGRLQHLSTSGAVTKKALEQARTTQQLTESALREARVQRAAVRRGGARMRSAEASVRQAEAAVALAQAHLDSCRIVAPAAGVIIAREAEVGDVVGPTTTVLQLAARSRTELIAELDERNLSALAIGQRALASAEAFPEQTFAAVVHFIAPAVDAQRGTVEVRLLVQAPGRATRAGRCRARWAARRRACDGLPQRDRGQRRDS